MIIRIRSEIFLVVLLFKAIPTNSQGEIYSLNCNEGNNISFECPCPEEMNDCRFKKLFQGGYIVRDGVLNHRYQFNGHKTHITLKECNEDDEGTYVWMCGKCNVNRQFNVEVLKFKNIPLKCSMGGEISFECPCANELDYCRFKKLEEEEEYIVRDGVLNGRHHRFEFDEHKTHITLKRCNEDDGGIYVLHYGNVDMQFHLEILHRRVRRPPEEIRSNQNAVVAILVIALFSLFFCLILLVLQTLRAFGFRNCFSFMLP